MSLFLVGGALSGARAAALISVVGDTLLDISVRDADRSDVLSTLFTATHSAAQKRVLVLQDSVTGHIDRLQLVQTSFVLILGAVLGNDYRYTLEISQGVTTYRISLTHPAASSSTTAVQSNTPATTPVPPNATASSDTGLVMHFAKGSDNNTAPAATTPAPTPPPAPPQYSANQPNGNQQNNSNQSGGAKIPYNLNNPTALPNLASSFYMNASLDSNGNVVRKPIYYTPAPDGGYIYGTPAMNGQPASFWYIGPASQGIAVPINVPNNSTTTTTSATTTTTTTTGAQSKR